LIVENFERKSTLARKYISKGGRESVLRGAKFDRWNDVPYGKWTCIDGREVLFNRFYEPLFQRYPGMLILNIDPCEWVQGIVNQEWFYDDSTSEPMKRAAGKEVLNAWLRAKTVLDSNCLA
jgi:hypothetical protein